MRSERWNGVRGENGSKEHQGHLADVLHRCFCDIISGAQQKDASDIHFRSFFRLTLAASTPMWWRDGSASVSTEHSGVMGVAVFGRCRCDCRAVVVVVMVPKERQA